MDRRRGDPVVWPDGVHLTDDGDGIEVDGVTYLSGGEVTGGGGEVPDLGYDPPSECESDLYIVVWTVDHP